MLPARCGITLPRQVTSLDRHGRAGAGGEIRMRHLIGFILAIALGAALFFGAGWGFTHLTAWPCQGAGLTTADRPDRPVGPRRHRPAPRHRDRGTGHLAAGTGPARPGAAGLDARCWPSASTRHCSGSRCRTTPTGPVSASLLVSGVLALLGAAMIVPLFMPARWQAAPGDGHRGHRRGRIRPAGHRAAVRAATRPHAARAERRPQ